MAVNRSTSESIESDVESRISLISNEEDDDLPISPPSPWNSYLGNPHVRERLQRLFDSSWYSTFATPSIESVDRPDAPVLTPPHGAPSPSSGRSDSDDTFYSGANISEASTLIRDQEDLDDIFDGVESLPDELIGNSWQQEVEPEVHQENGRLSPNLLEDVGEPLHDYVVYSTRPRVPLAPRRPRNVFPRGWRRPSPLQELPARRPPPQPLRTPFEERVVIPPFRLVSRLPNLFLDL